MKIFFFLLCSIGLILLTPYSIGAKDNKKANEEKIKVSLEKKIPSGSSMGSYTIVNEIQEWSPKETAIIICDMWNEHWCKGATDRVTEMAPFMNKVVSLAREKGKVIYTSLGHWEDWKNEKFRRIMFNAVDYLLNKQN
jgi:hypothetical protein